ncbi:MAG: 1-acyl-sn-glycerol-3-phosphate acyltransferase [Alphaproteobacteria bacterium]|nr:1-acyl-sn-glycerol-3-phosphate acyltransferase [Alphaproteobacteria bacterium]
MLRSALFSLFVVVWAVIVPVLVLPLLLLPRRAVALVIRRWAGGIEWAAATVLGLGYVVRGRDNLPAGACVIAANHQSTWETLMLYRILDDAAFVLKRELAWAPFGWFPIRAGSIAVDRSGHAAALRHTIRAARTVIANGQQLVIFPQGTRTPPGARRAFQPGVAALYHRLGVPVIPVALNSGSFWGRRAFYKRPGRVVVEFLPAIPPGLDRRRFMALLTETITTAAERLTAEVPKAHSET